MNRFALVGGGLALMLLTSCSSNLLGSTSSSSSSSATPPVPKLGQIIFLASSDVSPAKELQEGPSLPASMLSGPYADMEQKLLEQCTANFRPAPQPGEGAVAVAPIIAAVGSALISYAFNYISTQITNSIQSEVDKYKQSYKVDASGSFYYANGPHAQDTGRVESSRGDRLNSAIRCFRYSRMMDGKTFDKDGSNGDDLGVDVVGEMRIDPSGQVLQIRPLRIYFAQTKIPSGDVTLAVELSANSVWREGLTGKSGSVFDQVIVTEKFARTDIRPSGPPKYYSLGSADADWQRNAHLPLPTPSYGTDGRVLSKQSSNLAPGSTTRVNLAGELNFTATVAEVGTPPGGLTALQNLWKSQGTALTNAAISAIETQLGLSSASSSGKSGQ